MKNQTQAVDGMRWSSTVGRIARGLALGTALTLAPTGSAEAIPIQWTENGHYYDLVTTADTWENANAAAELLVFMGLTGHLATITSDAENDFVFQSVVQPGYGSNEEAGPWIGGFQTPGATEPSGGWNWVTGETWTYTNWHSGQPDNGGVNGAAESYLHYWSNFSRTWNDLDASRTSFYVVEYQPAAPVSVPDRANTLALLGIAVLVGVAGRHARRAYTR